MASLGQEGPGRRGSRLTSHTVQHPLPPTHTQIQVLDTYCAKSSASARFEPEVLLMAPCCSHIEHERLASISLFCIHYVYLWWWPMNEGSSDHIVTWLAMHRGKWGCLERGDLRSASGQKTSLSTVRTWNCQVQNAKDWAMTYTKRALNELLSCLLLWVLSKAGLLYPYFQLAEYTL